MELLEIKGFAKIKITDIAKKAMVNRNTIYLHYATKEDIAISILNRNSKLNSFGEDVIKVFSPQIDPIFVKQFFKTLIESLSSNIELYRLFMTDPNLNGYLSKELYRVKEKIATNLKKTSSNEIRLDYITSGSYGIISRWIIYANAPKEVIINELTNITVLNISRLELK